MSRLLITIIAGILFVAAQNASAQSATRIQFAKNTNFAVLKGKTRLNGVKYVVRAKAGQKLLLTLTPISGVHLSVQTTRKTEEEGNELLYEENGGSYELDVPDSADYIIGVGTESEVPIPFTLTVKITG